jgi:sulfate transport system ATP-binding protein
VIRIEGVSKAYGANTVLHDISLDVEQGEMIALLGPSGSGKSTLLRILAGLEVPDTGRVELDGVDVTGVAPAQRGIGFVFQHYAAFPHLTVWENVAFGLRVRRRPKKEIDTTVEHLLEVVGLSAWADRHPSQLSGGQCQRMALARALAIEPSVLLLDEPFGALDATVRAELRSWLRRLHDERGATTVIVTHDQQEAMDIADRVAVMGHGRLEQVGPPRELYEHPATAFVQGFLGQTTRLGDVVVRPHDVRLSHEGSDGSVEVQVTRVVHLGFEVRVELEPSEGLPVMVQLTRQEAEDLELRRGDVLWATPAGRSLG